MSNSLPALLIGLLALGGTVFMLFRGPSVAPQIPEAGAVSGPDVSFRMFFHDNIVVGGGVLATTSAGSVTYTAANIANNKLIEHKATAALTATLPTAAALNAIGFLPNAGDTAMLYIHASTTNITLAGGTGTTLYSASTTRVIPANSTVALEFVKLPANESSTYNVFMSN